MSMDFGDALRALKNGKRVSRVGWNGKGMWLFLVEVGPHSLFNTRGGGWAEELQGHKMTPSICMKTAQNTIVVGWLASQTDMLADDWEVIDG